jgi:muramoyltetrapeptide carboxypeptidase
MPDMHDNTVPFGRNAQEIVAEQTRNYPFPVAFVSGLGHSSRNLPLILNHRIEMNITADGCNMKWI